MTFKTSNYTSLQDSSLSKTHLVSSQSSTFYPISPITCPESSSSNMSQLEISPASLLAPSSSSLSVSDLVCSDISSSTECSKSSNNGHFPVSKSNPTHNPNQLSQETPIQTRQHHKTVSSSSSSVFPSNSLLTSNTLLQRPNMIRFYSTPTLPGMSPTRQHFRLANSHPRQIKVCIGNSFSILNPDFSSIYCFSAVY